MDKRKTIISLTEKGKSMALGTNFGYLLALEELEKDLNIEGVEVYEKKFLLDLLKKRIKKTIKEEEELECRSQNQNH